LPKNGLKVKYFVDHLRENGLAGKGKRGMRHLVSSDFLVYDEIMDQAVQSQIDILTELIVETVPVEQIYLFGSYAYGTPTPDSDLDLYVIMKDDAPLPELEAEQKISLARFKSQFRTLPVDILVAKKARFQRRLTAPTLEQEVANKGIVVYG
jgi:predicted nucleotidyltransferase